MAARKTLPLFGDLGVSTPPARNLRRSRYPVWTDHKARLIQRYLHQFVMVTRSGSYIDGSAGPQDPCRPDMWAAKLVLDVRPQLLRHFYLFEIDPQKFAQLDAMTADQERPYGRTIETFPEDCNAGIVSLLARGVISEREPTFAL